MEKRLLRVLIVDDEELARKALRQLLADFAGLQIVAEAENGFDAVRLILKEKPDLVFLDVQMPRLDGFDVLELLAEKSPPVIFVTAFDQYALRAFEASAVDYLLKPVEAKRLQTALAKAERIIAGGMPDQWPEKLIADYRSSQIPLSRILIRCGTEVIVLPVDQITHFKAEDDYVRIFTADKSWLKYERLNRLEQQLDCRQFCRVHRSYIVNLQFVKAVEPYLKNSRIVKLSTGALVPVSREGFKNLKKYF